MFFFSLEAQKDLQEIKEYIATDLENPVAAVDVVFKIVKTDIDVGIFASANEMFDAQDDEIEHSLEI